jgi:hypothetical protein
VGFKYSFAFASDLVGRGQILTNRQIKISKFDLSICQDLTPFIKDAILERMATKEPVKKISVEGRKDEWRTHKVVRVSEDDKVTVFSSRYNAQAQKFDQAIKEAEKEVEKGPRT